MAKPFYKFGDNIFREELWSEYIEPVSRWFMMNDKLSGYLLPQLSGSVWECSLAIDFLIRVYKQPIAKEELKHLIKAKVVNTARWLIQSLIEEKSIEGMSWDSAPWDTAVALRSVISCFEEFSELFTVDEKKQFKEYTIKICKWLLMQSKNWKAPDGYLTADSTDLAVTLSVLIVVYERFLNIGIPDEIKDIFNSINSIAKMLVQCVTNDIDLNGDKNQYNIENWGSCSNIGEVLCALGTYIACPLCTDSDKKEVEYAFLSGIKYIENKQSVGGVTDDSVADSCAIIWSYLSASQTVQNYGHNDIMIFRALCWMCDSNKVLNDGSFLHSSYVTVFYALSLILAYETWELGKKSTNEVYHVVVWLNPNIDTFERAKRLDLELKVKNYRHEIENSQEELIYNKVKKITLCVFISMVIITIAVLQISKAITLINLNFQLLDRSLFFSILGVALVVIPSVSKLTYSFTKKRYNK